jgi:hypothetical protein
MSKRKGSKAGGDSLNNQRANGDSQRNQVVFIRADNSSMTDVTVRNR